MRTQFASFANSTRLGTPTSCPSHHVFLAWAAAILLCTACDTVPVRPADEMAFVLPEYWQSTLNGQASDSVDWCLNTFNDAALLDLIMLGLSGNFDLRAAAARVEAAKEQATIAGAGRLPQLYFAPGYQHSRDLANGESGQFLALFNLSWELDVWGRIKASQQAALEDAVAATEDYQSARLSLAARLAQVYFQWLEARLQAQVAAQSVKDRSVIVELVRGRFNKGFTRGLDLRLALTDLANAEAQSAQMYNDVQILHKQLQTLLGRYPDSDGVTPGDPTNEWAPINAPHLPAPPPRWRPVYLPNCSIVDPMWWPPSNACKRLINVWSAARRLCCHALP